MHFANIKKIYQNQTKSRKPAQRKIDPEEAYIRAKNIALEDFLYAIASENVKIINASAEPLIAYSFIQLDNINQELAAGLLKVLELFGSIDSIKKKYELEAKKLNEENSRKLQNTRKSPLK